MFIFMAGYLDVHIGFLFDVSSSFRAPASNNLRPTTTDNSPIVR